MNREQAIRILRDHGNEIRALGVVRLALFGSFSRDEARDDSDVDVLVDLDDRRDLSLVDLAGLHLFLCDILGREVEVSERQRLKPYVKDDILSDALDVIG